MKKKLQEAIENVGMVNNVDGQNFEKDFVGTAPVSYADAVIRMREAKKITEEILEEQRKRAVEALKKETSNDEHPEPLKKIKVSEDGKLTLNESLFESFDDEHLGHGEDVCPKCGKTPCECNLGESVIRYPNGMEVTDIDLDKALDYQYGTDRDKDNSKYTDDEKQKAVTYWIKKTEPSPYDVSKEEVEPLEESKEDAKVFRVTYKHSPEVFSSVMIKAASEEEAKKKLSTKKPGKDIVGVSVMTDDEVEDMRKRGMSLMEAKVVDDFVNYKPWGEAVNTFDTIQDAGKMDALEQLIDDMYPDGINRTDLNDLLAFEADWVYSMLDMPHESDYDEPAVDFDEEGVVDEA